MRLRISEELLQELMRVLVTRTPEMATSLSIILPKLAVDSVPGMEYFHPRAVAGKASHLRAGYVGRHPIWDNALFDSIRAETGLSRCRMLMIAGSGTSSPDQVTLDTLRIHLSCPVISVLRHPHMASPVAAAHPFDLQFFGDIQSPANTHVGPGVVNLEYKVRFADVEKSEVPLALRGQVRARHVR